MATLYDYLAGLTVSGSPLIWSNRPLTKSQIDAAAGKPYVRVQELAMRPSVEFYGNMEVMEQVVDCLIYQAPTSVGTTPDESVAMALYFDILDAPHTVNEWTYTRPLIAIHRDVSLPPERDEDGGGLAGMIRFRLLIPQG